MIEENYEKELADAKTNIRHLNKFGTGGVFMDAGANIGEVSKNACMQFDEVISIECHQLTFNRMKNNLKNKNNITLINKAVHDKDGIKMFVSSPKNSTGATAREKKRLLRTDNYYFEAESISLNCLLEKYKPRVLKMDIEGSEYDAILNSSLNKELEFISIEFHGTRGAKTYSKFLKVYKKLKNENFAMIYPKKINLLEDGTAAKALYFIAIFEKLKGGIK